MEIKHEKKEHNQIYVSLMRFLFFSPKSSQQFDIVKNSESIFCTMWVSQEECFVMLCCVCVSV